MKKTKVLINPSSGNGIGKKLLNQQGDWLAQATDPNNIEHQLKQFLEPDDRLIIAGGDGTIHLVINALFQLNLHTQVKVSLLPLGTGNDLAKSLQMPFMPLEKKVNQIQNISTPISLPLWQCDNTLFINYLSWGIDVKILARVSRWRQRFFKSSMFNKLLYAFSSFCALFDFNKHTFSINNHPVKCYSIVLSNIKHYGGGSIVGTDESMTSPTLNLITLNSKFSLLRLVCTRLTKKYFPHQIQEKLPIKITTSAPCQNDGEVTSTSNDVSIDLVGHITIY